MNATFGFLKKLEQDAELNLILKQNREWAANQTPEYLEQMSTPQKPNLLYIGCSDSRILPSTIFHVFFL